MGQRAAKDENFEHFVVIFITSIAQDMMLLLRSSAPRWPKLTWP